MKFPACHALFIILIGAVAGKTGTAGLPETVPASGTGDWSGAVWIGDGSEQPSSDAGYYADDPAPQFRKTFSAPRAIRAASLQIAGLGFYEASINGRPLSDNALAPLWTPYGQRVLYDTYDVAEALKVGDNVLSVSLGNGWYNPLPLRMWGRFNLRDALAVGRPCLVAKLEICYEDGTVETVVSDASWRVSGGPLLRNSLYLGEVYDARLEQTGWDVPGFDDSEWDGVIAAPMPGTVLDVRIADGDRVRLGAHLASGTTVMAEVFCNFNAGTLGTAMVEGRISQGVVVGPDSDIGGGASIMGTLSGGGSERITIGSNCLLGANSGLGISLGDGCVVEAGLYLTAGSRVLLPDGDVVKAKELSGAAHLLFRRNSQSGAIEAVVREGGSWTGLNDALHAN